MPIQNVLEAYGNDIIGAHIEANSGGHTIQNSQGTDLTQEDKLQFKDSHVTDDSTNGKTVVENFKAVTQAEYSSETEDGAYIITDGNGATIGPASEDYVEVTASSDTRGTLLTKLYNAIDKTKVTGASYIVYGNYIYLPERIVENGSLVFNMLENPSSGKLRWSKINLTTPYFYEFSVENGVTLADKTSDSVTDGTKITLYYGQKKAVVDLQTTANRCWYDSNTTVKQKIDEKISKSISYNLTLINGWVGSVSIEVNSDSKIVGISGYLDGSEATSDVFADAGTSIDSCISGNKMPVSAQAVEIVSNQINEVQFKFVNTGSTWTVECSHRSSAFSCSNVYFRA